MSAQAYAESEQTSAARVPCANCDASIHIGPYVTALRDTHDPLLSNQVAAQQVWYHTSTAADWPSAVHTGTGADAALHVGNYATAVENMLRRMSDQGDASNRFYLHRVSLCLRGSDIEEGFRDENHEPAAQLGLADLEIAGVLAVRYMNTLESPGSLSMAIDPAGIAAIQSIELPVDTGPRTEVATPELGERMAPTQLGWLLAQTYLDTAVNPQVQESFCHALVGRLLDTSCSPAELDAYARNCSGLLVCPRTVMTAVSTAPARPGQEVALVRERRASRGVDGVRCR
ncbi:hypothetical protein OG225_40545 (plasmid) [Nocardia sp. NBC_01377]|uniref:hypothetical protein n=1 Tax=Nocardia sp. NBC_01377 TaxID=2903595 RepID=UPI003253183C